MEYRVLGPLEVRDGERSLPLAGARQRALLALLLVNANHVVSRDRLIDELWGEQAPETAVSTLQTYISRLRKVLPADKLLTRPPGYLLELEDGELDLRRFERLLAEARDAVAAGDPERAAHDLHDALALWRGPALAEFAFEPFAQAEIGRLENLRLAAVEDRIDADLALGRHADLIGELEALIAENPHRERLRGQLMLALYRSGRQAEALQAYQDARHALVDELGIEPSDELQQLEKQILTHDVRLQAPTRPRSQAGQLAAPPPTPERKTVTVLFADLGMTNDDVGDPEDAGVFLDRIGDEAAAEIEAAGGTVERGLAGALLATFGAERARQDAHAVRAVSAALATRNRLTDVFGDALSLRMSVASGDVILGRPGSFVTGTPVASAARLLRLAQPGEVVVGERAAAATAGAFELQHRDGAYLLVGALAPRRSPAQIRKRRRLLIVVGVLAVGVAIAGAVAFTTGSSAITVPPNSVGIIDPETNKVVGSVGVGSRPDAIADGFGSAWVANLDEKTLSRINLETHIEKTIPLQATPTGLAVGPDAVWVAYGYLGGLSRVDPHYNSVSTPRSLPINRSYHTARGSVAFGARSVWVAYGDSSIFRISQTSGHLVDRLFAGTQPAAIAFGLGSVWIANWLDASVTRIDPSTNSPKVAPITVGLHPSGVTVGGGAVWVTNTASDTVSRIASETGPVATAIPVGRAPVGIAYGAESVWVANSGDGTVSRIDPRTNKVVATIPVGNKPSGIAAGDNAVWVTEQPAEST
jgi:YVTN family beta-propeller protein